MPGAQPGAATNPEPCAVPAGRAFPSSGYKQFGANSLFFGVFDPLLAWVGFTSGLVPWGWAGQAARPGGQRWDLSTEGWRRKTQSGEQEWEELAVLDWCCRAIPEGTPCPGSLGGAGGPVMGPATSRCLQGSCRWPVPSEPLAPAGCSQGGSLLMPLRLVSAINDLTTC